MRKIFDEKLDKLNNRILEAAMYTEEAIKLSIGLLSNHDPDIVMKVTEYERLIDKMEKEIEQDVYRIIIEEQPVATDLKIVTSALQIGTDLERISDQCRDIAELTVELEGCDIEKYLKSLADMADATIDLVNKSITSYTTRNLEVASSMDKLDDVVDDYFDSIRDEIVKGIKTDDSEARCLVDVLLIAKYLERIADHGVNISEWVEFILE